MLPLHRFVVIALERVCAWLDCIPTLERREDGTWARCYGAWGCGRLSLAQRAAHLDARWHTGVWG